ADCLQAGKFRRELDEHIHEHGAKRNANGCAARKAGDCFKKANMNMDNNTQDTNYISENPQPEKPASRPGRGRYFAGGLFAGILCGVLLCAAMAVYFGGTALLPYAVPQLSGEQGSAVNEGSESKLRLLESFIDQNYYYSDEVTTQQKEDGMYKGLISSLNDPYSEYFTDREYIELNEDINGAYYGIGCYVSQNDAGYAVIVGVMKDSPAEKAGVLKNDLISEVDGENVVGLSLDDVVRRIKGEEGTVVHLTLFRESDRDYVELDVTRGKIDSQTVFTEMMEDGIGYLELMSFDAVSTDQFSAGLDDLKAQGMKALILDLRNNLGGNVTTVTEIGNMLLPEGLVFYMEDKQGHRTEYPCGGADFDYPLVVLVNEYSASASEILAGAVQDAGIGTLVGTQTYGKGVVQTVFPFADGTAVKLTIANYFTRGGRNIDKIGITPDIVTELDLDAWDEDQTDTQLEEGKRVLREKMGITP
ncbi:MAG: S41 family peptidase, partial [Lachnospiraceae bacterium]|nr:S41 family peptidase [Lachnospiraceae bacterium]